MASMFALVALAGVSTFPDAGQTAPRWTHNSARRLVVDATLVPRTTTATPATGRLVTFLSFDDPTGRPSWFVPSDDQIARTADVSSSASERSNPIDHAAAVRAVLDASGVTRDLQTRTSPDIARGDDGVDHVRDTALGARMVAVQAAVWHFSSGLDWDRSATTLAGVWAQYDQLVAIGEQAVPTASPSATIAALESTDPSAPTYFVVRGTSGQPIDLHSTSGTLHPAAGGQLCDTSTSVSQVPADGAQVCLIVDRAGPVTVSATSTTTGTDIVALDTGNGGDSASLVGLRDDATTESTSTARVTPDSATNAAPGASAPVAQVASVHVSQSVRDVVGPGAPASLPARLPVESSGSQGLILAIAAGMALLAGVSVEVDRRRQRG